MPIYEFTAPDGKTYEVEGPEGSTKEQAFQRLQQQLSTGEAAPTNAAAAPAAPAAPAINPETGAAAAPFTDASGQFHNTVGRIPKAGKLTGAADEKNAATIAGVSARDLQNYGAAIGETGVDTYRKGKKLAYGLGNLLGMDNSKELAALDEETKEARKINESLQNTKAGMAGQITGDALQAIALTAATGGVVNPALSGAARLAGTGGKVARALTNPATRAILTDTLAGGAQGALQDTTADESTLKNAVEGGLWGSLFPGLKASAKPAKKLLQGTGIPTAARALGNTIGAIPMIGAGPRGIMRNIEEHAGTKAYEHANRLRQWTQETGNIKAAHRAETSAANAAARAQQQAINRTQGLAHKEAGEKLRSETLKRSAKTLNNIENTFKLPITPSIGKEIRAFQQTRAGLLSKNPDLARALAQLNPSVPGAKVTLSGKTAMEMKSAIGAEAREATGAERTALHKLERLFENSIYNNMPAARADALKKAWTDYGEAISGRLKPAAPKPVVVKPNLPQLNLPAAPVHPDDMPYSRSFFESLRTAAGRGATMQRDD